MKLTKESLKKIIKEELQNIMDEGYAEAELFTQYAFSPEQEEVLRDIAGKLNELGRESQYVHLPKATWHLKNKHPAFKGFKGGEIDIQTGLTTHG
jgi:hypothetical protein